MAFLVAAACGGEPEAPSPRAREEAPPADAEAGGEPAEEAPAPAPAWEPPEGFRTVVPAGPGSGDRPRLIEHRASGVELLLVPAGRFELGSTEADPGHADDEAPAREVDVPAFYLARTETTWTQWRRGGGERGRAEGDDHPVIEVSWDQAVAWCAANGLQLPTEAQWEYAASGPEDRVFPWGERSDPTVVNALGTNVGDRWDLTAPVGSLPEGASWCGALDLAGNVAEWCRSPWTADHASPPDPDRRVIRGGSYTCRPPWCLRTAYRDGIERELQSANLGFRAALEIE